MNEEMVIHPNHYNKEGRKECWDEMINIFGPDAVIIFDVLSAYKYMYRAGEKDNNPAEQDLAKIKNYMKHAKDLICSSPIWRDGVIRGLSCDCWTAMDDMLEEVNKNEK